MRVIRTKRSWCGKCRAFRTFYVLKDDRTGLIVYVCQVCLES